MIFGVVGTQIPFDRMMQALDEWAGRRARRDVFAQIGPTAWRPRHMTWAEFVEPVEFGRRVAEADVVVAHAGMGSILTALELGKPILVMPRRADLGEHRNDHQLATARRFLAQGRISVAFDGEEMMRKLDGLAMLAAAPKIGASASPELVAAIRRFIHGEDALQSAGQTTAGGRV